MKPIAARAFVALFHVDDRGLADAPSLERSWLPAFQHASQNRRMQMSMVLRDAAECEGWCERAPSVGTLVLGSDAEWCDTGDDACMAAGVAIRYDLDRARLRICTSIVGLPPIFLYRTPARIAIASDLWLLRCVLGVPFDFDARGVTDFCQIGYPTEFRTLFENIRRARGKISRRGYTR